MVTIFIYAHCSCILCCLYIYNIHFLIFNLILLSIHMSFHSSNPPCLFVLYSSPWCTLLCAMDIMFNQKLWFKDIFFSGPAHTLFPSSVVNLCYCLCTCKPYIADISHVADPSVHTCTCMCICACISLIPIGTVAIINMFPCCMNWFWLLATLVYYTLKIK